MEDCLASRLKRERYPSPPPMLCRCNSGYLLDSNMNLQLGRSTRLMRVVSAVTY